MFNSSTSKLKETVNNSPGDKVAGTSLVTDRSPLPGANEEPISDNESKPLSAQPFINATTSAKLA
jgi:hypothetical protein